ncbi:styrene monooxygenase/indole monooxygenase family protein, partial [Nocardia abscessus]|uniref:styrene monooxygenase/indole monooxygenase family protein n=1 Tax=Nocardia abscessus TaxID=120957 RepID=UPI00313B46EE
MGGAGAGGRGKRARPAQEGVGISIAPDVGELLEIPLVSRHGWVTALLFETLPDTETAAL